MAMLPKARSSGVISNFRQTAAAPGALFGVLAQGMNIAYETLLPAAVKEMETRGTELGRQMARQQMGDPNPYLPQVAKQATGGAHSEGVSPAAQAALDRLQGITGPLTVTSAFRSPAKNAAVKGAKGSQHLHGNAFDVDVSGMSEVERVALIEKARGAGFSGIGVYKNSLHFDVGGDRAWGADYHRGSLPPWAAKAVSAPIGSSGDDAVLRGGLSIAPGGKEDRLGTDESAPPPAAPEWEPTLLRTSDGKLEARLYSPLAGPILQAHNAAAGVAYASEVMDKGIVDLMGLSEKFQIDPEGYQKAAQGYVDEIVKNAPEAFRPDLRSTLETEAQRRFLGVYEDYHRDIRQRAANSSAALVDRWGDTYADALASGNQQEADAALAQLGGVLAAREQLPGLAWTPEQSDNVIRKAHERAAAAVEARQKEQTSIWKKSLALITKAAKAGQSAADESLLNNPLIDGLLPEEAAEAASFVALRDNLPSFHQLTPGEQDQAVADLKADPVTAEFQLDIAGAAEDAAKANRAAWEKDPMGHAAEVLTEKPPPLPDASTADPEQVQESLAARREYANRLMEKGYFDFPSFLSDAEAEQLGALMGKAEDPAIKAALAGMIVAGFGEDAAHVFREIKSDDAVTLMAGQLMASGGEQAVAIQAMRGQQMIDEGLVQVPTKGTRIGSISPEVESALTAASVPVPAQGQVMEFAMAIYAADAKGVDPTSQTAKDKMAKAVQLALGQSQNKRGQTTGGVQKIGGFDTLLPPGVSGDAASAALEKAAGVQHVGLFGRVPLPTGKMDEGFWEKVGSGVPKITPSLLGKNTRLVSMGGNNYRMETVLSGGIPKDVVDQDGKLFVFDITKLIEAGR